MSKNESKNESGIVLFLCLVFMAIATMLSLFTMRSATSEAKIAINVQSRTSAFTDSEIGVASGENTIAISFSGAPSFDWSANSTDGYYYDGNVTDLRAVWNGASGYESGDDDSQFIIEYLGPFTTDGSSVAFGAGTLSTHRFVYRVTGKGQGARAGFRLAQSIYAVSE